MKKTGSFLLKSALVLCIVGVILLGVGLATGGTTVMKDGVHLSLSKVHWDLLDYLPSLKGNFGVNQEVIEDGEDSLIVTRDESVKTIDIDATAVKLIIKTVPGSNHIDFSCDCSKEKNRLGFSWGDEDTIKIRPKHEQSHLSLSKAPTVTITFPTMYTLENLNLDMAHCSVKMNGLLHINNCDVDIASGNFKAKNVEFKNLKIDNAFGNVKLGLFGEESDYNFDLDCAVGNIHVGDDSENGFANEYKKGTGENTIRVDSAAGNVNISFLGKDW